MPASPLCAGLTHDPRRGLFERGYHVRVDGPAVAVELPVGWHRDEVPIRIVEAFLVEILGAFIGATDPVEAPIAVEGPEIG